MKFIYAVFFGLLLWSCSSKKEAPAIQWDFQRVEREMASAKSDAEMSSVLTKYPEISVGYFGATTENTPFLAQDLYRLYANPALRKFYDQSQEASFFGGDSITLSSL